METRLAKRTLLLPALFALASLMLASFIWITFGGPIPFQASGYRVHATFPQASNLYPGDDVRIAGINVGQVVAVSRRGDRADVTLQLQPEYAPLPEGARAILRTKTLLGEAYVELAPGGARTPAIPDGGSLRAGHVVAAQQLSDALSTFDPRTRAQLRSMIGGIAAAFAGRGEDLSQGLGWSAPAMVNLGGLLRALDQQRTSLGQFIAGAGQVLNAVGARQGAVQAAIDAGRRVLSVTAGRATSLSATVAELPPFLTQLRAADHSAAAAAGDLSAAVAALQPAAPLLTPGLRAAATLSARLKALFAALPALIAAGQRGLPAATRIAGAARPLVERLLPAAEQLVPVLQLSAVVRNSIVAAFADVASTAQGSLPQPDGSDPHYLAAIQLGWNEAIGGYQKRLPTNRQNPYPAPDSELNIAHGGLHAYDCRNLGNPNLVPALLGSAPPCITQGPWTFNGLSAYFPRLQQAAP